MKAIRLIIASLFAGALCAFAAEPQAPATTTTPAPVEKPACCVRAEKKGKTCKNPCCVAAAKEGKVCEKCLKNGHGKKKKKNGGQDPVDHSGHEHGADNKEPAAEKSAQ